MQVTGTRAQRKAQAEKFIRHNAVLLKPGEALPALRKLMDKSGFGRNILEAAIKQLIDEQILVAKERSGIYRTGNSDSTVNNNVVDIIACSEISYMLNMNSFMTDLIEKLISHATTAGFSSRVHRVSFYDPISAYEALMKKMNMRSCILLSPHTVEIIKLFESSDINSLNLLPQYQPHKGPAIIDAPDMVDIQLEHLIKLGHTRIAFIDETSSESPSLTHVLRREAYYRKMAENGLRVKPGWVIKSSINEKQLFEDMTPVFTTVEPPTAIVSCDVILASIYRFAALKQLKIGYDLSIIASDGMENNNLYPEPTTVINSREAIAKLAIEYIQTSMQQSDFQRIEYVDLTFQQGASTGPPVKE